MVRIVNAESNHIATKNILRLQLDQFMYLGPFTKISKRAMIPWYSSQLEQNLVKDKDTQAVIGLWQINQKVIMMLKL